jgi:hypothetical protein
MAIKLRQWTSENVILWMSLQITKGYPFSSKEKTHILFVYLILNHAPSIQIYHTKQRYMLEIGIQGDIPRNDAVRYLPLKDKINLIFQG